MAVTDCIRTCRNCGCEFRRTAKGQPTKYCSSDCRDRARGWKGVYRQTHESGGLCASTGCDRRATVRGHCSKHYRRQPSGSRITTVERGCRGCGAIMRVERGSRKAYCSTACQKARKAVRRKAKGYKPQKQRQRQAECVACKTRFMSVPSGKSPSGWTQCCGRHCGTKVAARVRHLRAGTASWLRPVVVTTHHGHCAVCSKHYKKSTKGQLYCGHVCKMVAVGCYTPTERVCTECGSSFIAGRWQRQCSDQCKAVMAARARRVARARRDRMTTGRLADAIDPIRVFERDRWKCHLCGCKTNKAKRGTCHPKAPELEHIVSLADGGSHTWGNVACACRACNAAKGARSMGQLGLGIAA